MKVALIIERIETWRGGAETSTVQFASHLARQGCRVHVLTASVAPSTPDIEVITIPASPALRGVRTWLFARRAVEWARREGFDILHGVTACLGLDVYQPRGGTAPETLARTVAAIRSPAGRSLKRVAATLSLKQQVVSRLERRLLAGGAPPLVIAISDYVRRQLRQHYGLGESHVRLVFNGVDPDTSPPAERRADRTRVRRQLGLADNDIVVLCVAHNFRLKGVWPLVEALARVPRDDVYAVIVGRDDPRPFAHRAEELGVGRRVLFAGPTQGTPAFYHAADMLVHPTFYDPCSRVVLEAMAAGLPVVTTRFNGAAERVTDGREGYVIDCPRQVEALADRITRLLDEERRRACAARAPLATTDISMAEHARRVLAVYEEVCARRS